MSFHVKTFNDVVHGYVELADVSVRIVDTPEFQRLRDVRQLGGVQAVYPCAGHSRFEHVLGTAHTAREFITQLAARQPELGVSARDMLCVELAGLIHDLGHGLLSHLYDGAFVKRAGSAAGWQHEHASAEMFVHIINKYSLIPAFRAAGLVVEGDGVRVARDAADDIHFVQELVFGNAGGAPDGWVWHGRGVGKEFLFEIVSNKVNGIDVDKLDYFSRDCKYLNVSIPFDAARLLKFARVVEHPSAAGRRTIAYPAKDAWNVLQLFASRYSLHKRAYQHRVARVVEIMYTEALLLADAHIEVEGAGGRKYRMSNCMHDMEAYAQVTDYLLQVITHSRDAKLQPARALLQRIARRDLYPFIAETVWLPSSEAAPRATAPGAGAGSAHHVTPPRSDTTMSGVKRRLQLGGTPEPAVGSGSAAGVSTGLHRQLQGTGDEDMIRREILALARAHADVDALNASAAALVSSGDSGSGGDSSQALTPPTTGGCAAAAVPPLALDDLLVEIVTIHMGTGTRNPSDRVLFYHKDKVTGNTIVAPIASQQVSVFVPSVFQEQYVRLYCRRAEVALQARSAFDAWCATRRSSQPLPFSPWKRPRTDSASAADDALQPLPE